jgi:hypothetical protein
VACTPELADYPLLGRALPAHGGPSPPPRLIGVPSSTAAALSAAEPAASWTETSSTSSARSSATGDSSSSWVAFSELCLVAQVNKIQPGMLPPADDSAWEDLVKGGCAITTSSSSSSSRRRRRLLGLTSASDVALLRPLSGSHGLLFALFKAGIQLMLPAVWVLQKLTAGLPIQLLQPAYVIDAESKILRPLVRHLLNTESEMLLKDR